MRALTQTIFAVSLVLGATVGANAASPAAKTREATLQWKAVAKAKKYQIELANNPDLDPVLIKHEVSQATYVAKLMPGTYYFRIRAFDEKGVAGAWSEVEGFAVNAAPPEMLEPKAGASVEKILAEGLRFSWRAGLAGSRFSLEIRDKHGVVLRRSVDETSYAWMPSDAGEYKWRIGYESQSGTEWNEYRSFAIKPSAIAAKVQKVVETKVETRIVNANDFQNCSIIEWLHFQAGGVLASHGSLKGQGTGEFSWNPRCTLSQRFLLRAGLGLSFIRGSSVSYPVVEPTLHLGYALARRWRLELGTGAQVWVGNGGAAGPLIALTGAWVPSRLVDRLYFSYSTFFGSGVAITFLKLGLGFNFGETAKEQVQAMGAKK